MTCTPLWILLITLLSTFHAEKSFSDPRATEAATICSNRTAPNSDRQSQISNFSAAVDSITTQAFRQGYGSSTNGTGNTTVYAFAECMKDLSQTDCRLCLAHLKVQTTKCRPFQRLTKGGTLFYDGCFLRYEDYMFFDEVLGYVDRVVCGEADFVGDKGVFGDAVLELVRRVSLDGPRNDGFYTGLVRRGGNLTVYGLGQCWEYVNRSGCVECLENSVSRIGSCAPKVEGRVLNAGCYVRYSTTRFYNNSASHSGNEAKKKLGALSAIVNKSKINYSYETLERATNYFNESNKLGQGGSGSVYKGILPGGQIVAVKRLMFNTTQWADHFFNEVNLISGINHKNLVKLLGCSITGPESLLVYEYVPNLSLHDHLFGRKGDRRLGWEERYKVILGIAAGLQFLHEESNLRIIHRDIKLSNVLLDEDFTAKIADFGLARLFPEDKSHISTGIAGTLGYMAPEYIVRGKLSEKADVYSFGVLVIEVVCGTKVNAFAHRSYSVLQKVWNMYGTGKLSEVVDSSINEDFPEEEANRLLKIGLTCVQADAELRPSMSVVVKMITGKHEIFSASQPPFLSSSSSETSSAYQPGTYYYQPDTCTGSTANEITESFLDPR
ncbi:cysteine-rich receptor-like protein kinase 3 [Phtheirospermum japonicum]|uniref:Cysteine-rich receptor-like protein kinase 3 n=1 Tax=Phtheirospermum japonicum TaxID=374723 RepID=A0A830CR23_9LAMI|nr:cysteine-rich receptor-like protein kinase 3 [Phtheirospermum japonicum]